MLRLGIIGTHTIFDQMIHAAQDTGKYYRKAERPLQDSRE